MNVVRMPPNPLPKAVPLSKWEDLVRSELLLIDMESDLRAMESDLESARQIYNEFRIRVTRERSRILALLAQGAEIENSGRIIPV